MKFRRTSWLVGGGLMVLAWGNVTPVLAQDLNCCMRLISVKGNWFGAIRTCEDYIRNHASPETRRSICNQVVVTGMVCPETAGTCDNSYNGKYCGDNTAGSGMLYAGTLDGRIYSEPSFDSTVVGSPPSGTRLRYTKTMQVNGQIWYYITSPGRPPGWMLGNQLSCTRPQEPPAPRIINPLPADDGFRPTTPQVSAARG